MELVEIYKVLRRISIFAITLSTTTTIILSTTGVAGYKTNSHRNVSELLDSLLEGYDNSIRPDFGGPPTIVEIDIMIRTIGPVSEIDMYCTVSLYLRQSWVDKRLSYNSTGSEALALSVITLEKLWRPDSYFYNGRQSYLHTITTPNKFVRLYQTGRILYSSRLTVHFNCPMDLSDFPMDTQRCPLKIGSFGYDSTELRYQWNRNRTVDIAPDMKMSQFDLISTPTGNSTVLMKSGEYSFLEVSFHLSRHCGNFLIQVYGPITLVVILSFVGFFLNREATADRVSLGVTSLFTITLMGLEVRTNLPKVPYPTAVDFYVFTSFLFIFASVIQFAMVHYFTKYGSGEVYFNDDSEEEDDEGGENENEGREGQEASVRPTTSNFRGGVGGRALMSDSNQMSIIEMPPHLNNGRMGVRAISSRELELSQKKYFRKYGANLIFSQKDSILRADVESANSVSKIDRFARIFFPLSYFLMNVAYWYTYRVSIS